MALKSSMIQCLPMLSGSTHSLPLKLGLTLWSGCQRKTSIRSAWTALSGVPNSPRSWNHQQCSFRSLARPHLPRRSAQPSMASRATPVLQLITSQGIRKLHSENSVEDGAAIKLISLLICASFVAWASYRIGRQAGVKDLTVQLPQAKISTEREALRKEEEELKHKPEKFTRSHHCGKCECIYDVRHDVSRERRKRLAEKKEALCRKELEHHKQRAIVLEKELEMERKSAEADRAERIPVEEVTAIHFRPLPSDKIFCYYPGGEEETTFPCPLCSGETADLRTRKVSISPSVNLVSQVAKQGLEANA